jgi:hypothetical protein
MADLAFPTRLDGRARPAAPGPPLRNRCGAFGSHRPGGCENPIPIYLSFFSRGSIPVPAAGYREVPIRWTCQRIGMTRHTPPESHAANSQSGFSTKGGTDGEGPLHGNRTARYLHLV